ncbi:MAG: hypothetical protein ACM3X7_10860 [Solirubrobacterales bacterium]
MKRFKIFMVGFLAFLIVQFGVLVFLETEYFTDDADYSSTKVENTTTTAPQKPKLVFEDGSTNVSASFDGNYISYLKDNNLLILNTEETYKIQVSPETGMSITYYKWIYDRNRLIIAERPADYNNGAYFKLYYYDVESKNKVEIFNEVNNKSIRIPLYNSNEKISTIDMSTLTNVIFVKLDGAYNTSRIYSINIMAQEKNINTVTHYIGKIVSTKKDDILLYEDFINKKVYRNDNNSVVAIDGKTNLSLVGIDSKDNVYLALTENNKTKVIYYGNITNGTWTKADLKKEEIAADVYVNFKGQIFIKDNGKSIINELGTGKGTYCNGQVLDLYENGVITEKNGEIIKNSYE